MSNNNRENSNKAQNKSSPGNLPPKNKVKSDKTKPGRADKEAANNDEIQGQKPASADSGQINKEDPEPNINELKTSKLSPETDMEVHHHPQLDHGPKQWKEYLLEGFMIFIAVMMGFIAENIRESIDNNEHARQLTSQLAYELREDIIDLDLIYREEIQIVKNNDTLFNLLQQPLAITDSKRIQKFIAKSHSMWPFHPSTGAITAIKNELHLKQFSNSEIISYISTYEGHMDLLHTVQEITLQYQRNFLDPFLYQHFTPANLVASFDKSLVPSAQMRKLTQEDLTQLAAQMVLIRINSAELVTNNRRLKNDAVKLLQYVNKQYHLND